MKFRLNILMGMSLLAVACAPSGCKSYSPSPYVSPRVEGRVVDALTRQPIRNAEVRRLTADQRSWTMEPPKGGEVLKIGAAAVRTAGDGTFVLVSERSINVIPRSGWFSVSLAFHHSFYQDFATNYTIAAATNTVTGEPLVRAGDIPLVPRAK